MHVAAAIRGEAPHGILGLPLGKFPTEVWPIQLSGKGPNHPKLVARPVIVVIRCSVARRLD
jgi:hypothetical protein